MFLFLMAPVFCFSQSLQADYLVYIETYKETAVRQQQEYGIPASITLAQGLLESGAGLSRLATEGNNHFGIKCHNTWEGDRIYQDDDKKDDCFRRYKIADESFEDHARFLKRKRYASLFKLDVTDYKGWAAGLKKCGYATDPSYASKLVSIIELYSLDGYDTGQPLIARPKHLEGDESLEHSIDMEIINEFKLVHKIRRKWGLYYITLYDGDSFEAISDEFGIKKKKLLQYNDLSKKASVPRAGEMLYLQEKNDSGVGDCPATHVIRRGETFHAIAQHYGIKSKSLMKINGLGKNDVLRVGQTIRLR